MTRLPEHRRVTSNTVRCNCAGGLDPQRHPVPLLALLALCTRSDESRCSIFNPCLRSYIIPMRPRWSVIPRNGHGVAALNHHRTDSRSRAKTSPGVLYLFAYLSSRATGYRCAAWNGRCACLGLHVFTDSLAPVRSRRPGSLARPRPFTAGSKVRSDRFNVHN